MLSFYFMSLKPISNPLIYILGRRPAFQRRYIHNKMYTSKAKTVKAIPIKALCLYIPNSLSFFLINLSAFNPFDNPINMAGMPKKGKSDIKPKTVLTTDLFLTFSSIQLLLSRLLSRALYE